MITEPSTSSRASIPTAHVKKLKPAFIRAHHLGFVTKPHAINRLNRDAAFARMGQIEALASAENGRTRVRKARSG